jgi:hypothetical protein
MGVCRKVEVLARFWLPVGINKPGCRVLVGVVVMCPAGCKGVICYAVAKSS